MKNAHRPKAFIVGGANASGKSTFISFLLENGIIEGVYVSPDLILKSELGLNETPKNYMRAFRIAKRRRDESIRAKKDIIVETTFSSGGWVGFCEELKRKGYYTTFVFTATNDPYINAFYLMKRVKEGGHDVPLRTLLKRREKGFANIKKILRLVDSLVLLDNSMIGRPPVVVKEIFQNKIRYEPPIKREVKWLGELGIDLVLPKTTQEKIEGMNLEELNVLIEKKMRKGIEIEIESESVKRLVELISAKPVPPSGEKKKPFNVALNDSADERRKR